MTKMSPSTFISKPEVRRVIDRWRAELLAVLPGASFGEREEVVLAVTNELARDTLEHDLREIAEQFDDEVLVDGVLYRRHEPGTGTYHSLCGSLVVARHTYRKAGVHNGPTVVPLELYAGLVEHGTPALAFSVTHGFAERDMRQHEETLRAAHRVPPARTTLERMANRIGATAVTEAPRIEKKLRRSERIPENARGITIGLDRSAVAMVEPRPEGAPPKPEPKRRTPRVRKAPAPTDINWRMAYVGTVSFVDEHGEAVEIRRYASPACDDPRELVGQMMEDVRAALRRDPTLKVGIVQDGAPEMWNRTREGVAQLRDEGLLGSWYEGIDRYHLIERIADALMLIDDDAKNRERLLTDWTQRFDCDDATIETVERYILRRVGDAPIEAQKKLWDHLTYIRNNNDRMRYATLRAAGFPVGSGVTESAARTVIGQRAKGCGRRWREANLRGVLTLRAHHQSGRLPRFWSHLSGGYAAHIEAA